MKFRIVDIYILYLILSVKVTFLQNDVKSQDGFAGKILHLNMVANVCTHTVFFIVNYNKPQHTWQHNMRII